MIDWLLNVQTRIFHAHTGWQVQQYNKTNMYTEIREEWENRPKCHSYWGRAGQLYGLIPLVPTLVRKWRFICSQLYLQLQESFISLLLVFISHVKCSLTYSVFQYYISWKYLCGKVVTVIDFWPKVRIHRSFHYICPRFLTPLSLKSRYSWKNAKSNDKNNRQNQYFLAWVSDYYLMPNKQFFSYIMAKTRYISWEIMMSALY